ncbi:MAG: sensor histidine kinase [Bacteroidota bacterium]
MADESNKFKDLQIACAILGTNISALSRAWGVSDTWIKSVAEGRGKSNKISNRIDETIQKAAKQLPSSFLTYASKAVADSSADGPVDDVLMDVLKETHHRIKNQLAQLSSIVTLELESSDGSDEKVIRVLRDIHQRIKIIAKIHEQLSAFENDKEVLPLDDLILSLIQQMQSLYSEMLNDKNISFDVQCDRVELPIHKATHCALLIHELMSNALNHGFEDRESGVVRLELLHNGDSQIKGKVSDNGIGFDHERPPENDQLGLTLIHHFLNHLDADYSIDGSQGTHVEFQFEY